MTNPTLTETIVALRAYAKDQGGWHNIDDTCEAAASHLERLQAENDRLREAAEAVVDEYYAKYGYDALTLADLIDDLKRAALGQEEGR